MAKIRIEVFEGGTPSATITIPGWVVTGASKLLPRIAGKGLQEQIDFAEIVELLKNPQASGVILEVEERCRSAVSARPRRWPRPCWR
jgi:hypothetical protein